MWTSSRVRRFLLTAFCFCDVLDPGKSACQCGFANLSLRKIVDALRPFKGRSFPWMRESRWRESSTLPDTEAQANLHNRGMVTATASDLRSENDSNGANDVIAAETGH
jgi:hypothetical protein